MTQLNDIKIYNYFLFYRTHLKEGNDSIKDELNTLKPDVKKSAQEFKENFTKNFQERYDQIDKIGQENEKIRVKLWGKMCHLMIS